MAQRVEACIGAVAVLDDHLLLVRRGRGVAAGLWSLPGGRIEVGETLAEAVVREVMEETGLHGTCGAFIGHTELIGEGHHFVVLDFAVTILDDGEPVGGDDAIEARWVPRAEVSDLALTEGLAEFLADHGVIDLFC